MLFDFLGLYPYYGRKILTCEDVGCFGGYIRGHKGAYIGFKVLGA